MDRRASPSPAIEDLPSGPGSDPRAVRTVMSNIVRTRGLRWSLPMALITRAVQRGSLIFTRWVREAELCDMLKKK